MTEGLLYLAAEGQEGSSFLVQMLPFVLIIAVFYLLFFRPQQKRRQQENQMQNSLLPGQEIMTKSGMFGTIVDVHDNDIEVEVSPGTRIRMIKAGIAEVLTPQDPSGIEDHPDFPTTGSDDDRDNPNRP
ncbi:preprotein translocase subunit YajC [Spiractinospora alimapuensis]|uniref:preprotein translocase subunit YajC n=1 Tax=Spiractinospora alimapuensis TaxID=2820884 RepID=UPI003743646D